MILAAAICWHDEIPRRAREADASDLVTIINHTDDRPEPRRAAKREYVTRRTRAGRDL